MGEKYYKMSEGWDCKGVTTNYEYNTLYVFQKNSAYFFNTVGLIF